MMQMKKVCMRSGEIIRGAYFSIINYCESKNLFELLRHMIVGMQIAGTVFFWTEISTGIGLNLSKKWSILFTILLEIGMLIGNLIVYESGRGLVEVRKRIIKIYTFSSPFIWIIIQLYMISNISEEYFGSLLVSYCVLCILSWFEKEEFKQGNAVLYSLTIVKLLAYIVATSAFTRAVYISYAQSYTISWIWEYIWSIAMGEYYEYFVESAKNISWLSYGVTCLSGCLIIISWSKEPPTPQWNPYSARTLAISHRAPYIGLGVWSVLCYAVITGKHRLAFAIMLILLCINVTTLFYCYHMQDDNTIRRRVIRYMGCNEVLAETARNNYSVSPELRESLEYSDELKAYTIHCIKYIEALREITANVIRKMPNSISKKQVKYEIDLLEEVCNYACRSKRAAVMGFYTGIGCIPEEIDDPLEYENFVIYYEELFLHIKRKIADNQIKAMEKELYSYIACGMYLGILYLSKSSRAVIICGNRKRKAKQKLESMRTAHKQKLKELLVSNHTIDKDDVEKWETYLGLSTGISISGYSVSKENYTLKEILSGVFNDER